MSKQIVSFLMVVMVLFFSGCSSKEQVNKKPNQYDDSLSYENQMIIEQEVEKRLKVLQTQIQASEKAKFQKAISNWEKEIKYYEMGKYAIKKAYVTNPLIIPMLSDDGTVTIHNLGCKIQKPLDASEFIEFYSKDLELLIKENKSPSLSLNDNAFNNIGVNLAVQSDNLSTVSSLKEESKKEHLAKFQKTFKNTNILDDYALSYTVTEKELLVPFKDEKEYKSFCNKTLICSN